MLSRLIQPIRSSLLLQYKASAWKRWRCTVSSSEQKNEAAVFVVAGCDDYRIIDKTGATSSYIPPWSTCTTTSESSSVKIRRFIQVSNSCNGMMLIPHNNSIYLFNPATKYFQKVLQLNCKEDKSYYTTIGFCYDQSIDDYKALVFFGKNPGRGSVGGQWGGKFVAQASLKGKQWTKVEFPFQFRDVMEGPVLNGRLHWIAKVPETGQSEENIIVCFDPILNVFETFPSPPSSVGPDNNENMGLSVMDGFLWLTRWGVDNSMYRQRDIEVFKMTEYGVPDSWKLMHLISKDVRINSISGCMIPLLTMENGHILYSKTWAEQTNHGEIMVFNPETNWCHTHSVTPSWYPESVPFLKNLDSPVGYSWDPIQHQHFGQFDEFEYDNVSEVA